MDTEKEVKIIMWFILVRLENMKKWGGAHSELSRVIKSLPSQFAETAESKKSIKKAIKNLVNLGYIGIYKKTGEDHTSLNPRKTGDIKRFIRDVKESMIGNNYVK